jgi:hypothetical protein
VRLGPSAALSDLSPLKPSGVKWWTRLFLLTASLADSYDLGYPTRPYPPSDLYGREERSVRKSLDILDALVGDFVDVNPVKNGRGLALDTVFDVDD